MLATLGVLVQSFFTLPDPVFANGARPQTAAYELVTSRPEALGQIFLAVGAIELLVLKQDPEKAAGDLGFGAYPDTEEELEVLQLKELKNGRLAMMAIVGMFVQEKLTGQGPIEQLLVSTRCLIHSAIAFAMCTPLASVTTRGTVSSFDLH